MVNVGGFFASLSLKTNEDSFKKGIGFLAQFPGLLKNVGVGVAGAAVGMVAFSAATNDAMTKLAAQAQTLGMSARTLDNWRGAVGLAHGDADSFVESMMNMNEAFRNLKIGEVKTDFMTATGMSGANFAALQTMNNDQRLRTIWSALEKVSDPQKRQALIEKIFGRAGVDLFSRLQLMHQTIEGNYAKIDKENPNSDENYRIAIEGAKKQAEIMTVLEMEMKNLGVNISKAILPALDGLAKWMTTHQKELDDFAKAVGDATSWLIKFVTSLTDPRKAIMSAMLGGDEQYNAFRALEAMKGVKAESVGETALWLGPEWSALSKAMADKDLYNELSDDLKAKGAKGGALSGFSSYTSALDKTGLDIAQRYFAASELARGIQGKPQVNLSVSVDKSGNVTVTDRDTGKVLQSIRDGVAYGQNGSLLK